MAGDLDDSHFPMRKRLTASLPTALLLLIAGTALIILALSYFTATHSAESLTRTLMAKVSSRAAEKILGHLSRAEETVRLNARIFARSAGTPGFLDHFNDAMLEEMAIHSQFALIYFGDEGGNHWSGKRLDQGIDTKVVKRLLDTPQANMTFLAAAAINGNDAQTRQRVREMIAPIVETTWYHRDAQGHLTGSDADADSLFDPRYRAWYRGAREKNGVFWTDVYSWSDPYLKDSGPRVGVTVATPVTRDGQVLGVTGIDIVLEELSRFLSLLRIGKAGQTFLLDARGRTIGLTDFSQVTRKVEDSPDELELNQVSAIDNPPIVTAWKVLRRNLGMVNGEEPVALHTQRLINFSVGEARYLGYFKPLSPAPELSWIIGVVATEEEFLGEIQRNIGFAGLIAFLALLVALATGSHISRSITAPLDLLSEKADRIRKLDLSEGNIIESHFQEIYQVSTSVENMRVGLRSFSKYVPMDLVREVLASGVEARLGGERREITTYFSDIANFTTISESLPPETLVELLGEYLGALSDVIRLDHQGAVDKFIGDAIMAFWNAPRENPDHPYAACAAALDCQSALARLRGEWIARGLPEVRARVGINTGPALVGNLGAKTRMNYTVIGDSVNLASRLEGICKVYDVEIIIGPATWLAVSDRMEGRLLDYVTVKGKTQGVFIYELLGHKGRLNETRQVFLDLYQGALQAFAEGNWQQAEEGFLAAEQRLGRSDPAVAAWVTRCREAAQGNTLSPSLADWQAAMASRHNPGQAASS